ncbi:MAG: hypothetical protein LBG25_03770 [Spirochaetaceae bacterium]|jgi:hypothetical protein|nr:hypothetical protein [Spirochaetaceae bacterium]
MAKKTAQTQQEFWTEYEKRYGEKVHAYVLGRYLSGWPDYSYPLWGLLIATDRGFRFHHFAHEGWIQALSRITTGGEPPQEKTIFIPQERILSAELRFEKRWWKKILAYQPPTLAIRYHTGAPQDPETRSGMELLAETDSGGKKLLPFLTKGA